MKKFWVYIHTCPNGKRYVGITTQTKPEYRWKEGNGYQYNKHFYSAILKHGWDNFQHEVFEVDSAEEMYRKEIELISFYHSNDPKYGYNCSTGGESGFLGYRHSEEARKRISETLKQRCSDPEVRRKMSEVNKKKWTDSEYREKVSKALKGKSRSEETRKKIAEARKGKPFSEEHRKHLAEVRKGRILSEEHKRHISEACKNRPRIKISLPDGTVVEMTKQNLTRNYINKGRKFEYVSE